MTEDIVKRLRKVEPDLPGDRTRWYRNPDGPEAANEIEKLRAELDMAQATIMLPSQKDDRLTIERLRAENEKLRRAMHEIYEVYAGSEWLFSATCSEAYLIERMMEMVAIAAEHK